MGRHGIGRRLTLRCLALVALAAAISAGPASGQSNEYSTQQWWLAIDDFMPKLWAEGNAMPMEELLIFEPGEGRAENRAMLFLSLGAEDCLRPAPQCSDAPLIARAEVAVTDGTLVFSNAVAGAETILWGPEPNLDDDLRARAVTGTARWSYSLDVDGVRLSLTDDLGRSRQFVRVMPDQLRTLRAGFMALGLPASEHWRCFLANATSAEPGLSDLSGDPSLVPPDFADFLEAATHVAALQVLAFDDPAAIRAAGDAYEPLMVPRIEGFIPPTTAEEHKALQRQRATTMMAIHGGPRDDTLPLSEDAIDAFARATSGDPAYAAMACA